MSALKIDDSNFEAQVVKSDSPVLVDFWAPWCGPCRMMGPVVDELATEVGNDALVVKVNVDEAPETAARYGVTSIPTFVVIKDGEVTNQFGGVVDKEALRDAVSAA